jgi:hypothetical protein
VKEKANTRSSGKTPTIDLQVKGPDGVLYRIPAAELRQYAIPETQAFRIASGATNDCTAIADMIIPGGPSGGMSAMPPSMLARLVRVVVELGIEEKLEQALRGSKHEFSLPTETVRDLLLSGGGGHGSRTAAGGIEAGDGPFTRMTLLALGRTIAAAVRAGGFDKVLRTLRPLDAEFKITMTSGTSRSVKLVLHDVSRDTKLDRSQASVARIIHFSDCSCNPPPPKPPPPPPTNCTLTADTGVMGCPA